MKLKFFIEYKASGTASSLSQMSNYLLHLRLEPLKCCRLKASGTERNEKTEKFGGKKLRKKNSISTAISIKKKICECPFNERKAIEFG
jgi:hypothetical protein